MEVPEQIALAFITSESIKPKMNHRLLVKILKKKLRRLGVTSFLKLLFCRMNGNMTDKDQINY